MELKAQVHGKIFDIQGFSVHDGPGARTLIFLKGCPLHCTWCSNPEGISQSDTLLYYALKCIHCGNCADACAHHAIHVTDKVHVIDREICKGCQHPSCTEQCYTDALRVCGRNITVDDLFSIIRRDRQYWGPGGGITLTGGEPLLQIDFATELLERCYHAYIHTAIETCGHVPWNNFSRIIDFVDWIFFDLKHPDAEKHRTGTGFGNSGILGNIIRLQENFQGRLVFRLPYIPGYNTDTENLESIARLILGTKWKEINILPLHHLGREKYNLLGIDYKAGDNAYASQDELRNAKAIFEKHGITCYIGHDTLF